MHILHETWRCYWLRTSDVIFWSIVFVQSHSCVEGRGSWVPCWCSVNPLQDGLFVAWSWEAAGSDRNWSRFRWCWEHSSAPWFFPFKRWAVKEGFLGGEEELEGLNIWALSSALWRGAFSAAVVFVAWWKDGVDRGKRGGCTSMQMCSCQRKGTVTFAFFYNAAKGTDAE